jgi:hypothetical protein
MWGHRSVGTCFAHLPTSVGLKPSSVARSPVGTHLVWEHGCPCDVRSCGWYQRRDSNAIDVVRTGGLDPAWGTLPRGVGLAGGWSIARGRAGIVELQQRGSGSVGDPPTSRLRTRYAPALKPSVLAGAASARGFRIRSRSSSVLLARARTYAYSTHEPSAGCAGELARPEGPRAIAPAGGEPPQVGDRLIGCGRWLLESSREQAPRAWRVSCGELPLGVSLGCRGSRAQDAGESLGSRASGNELVTRAAFTHTRDSGGG